MRILLVDDDQEIRFALANVFQAKHKFTVVEASSGQEAIAALTAKNDFTLIISDFQMDNGNGDVIVDFLKNQKINVPLVFFSGSQEIKSAEISAPVLKCFAKSEVFHLIEYVEFLWSQTAQRAVV
ncbi:response regulator [Pseudobdellovibrio sp. HCB154]|uniref:response regulator n=1 Tax=Pseudobdellovibrio sp. HCB154 TaxID=3386277 RepID=UPI0039173934